MQLYMLFLVIASEANPEDPYCHCERSEAISVGERGVVYPKAPPGLPRHSVPRNDKGGSHATITMLSSDTCSARNVIVRETK